MTVPAHRILEILARNAHVPGWWPSSEQLPEKPGVAPRKESIHITGQPGQGSLIPTQAMVTLHGNLSAHHECLGISYMQVWCWA